MNGNTVIWTIKNLGITDLFELKKRDAYKIETIFEKDTVEKIVEFIVDMGGKQDLVLHIQSDDTIIREYTWNEFCESNP